MGEQRWDDDDDEDDGNEKPQKVESEFKSSSACFCRYAIKSLT